MINVLISIYRSCGYIITKRIFQAVFLFVALILYSTSGYMYFELSQNPDLTLTDAFWWSIVTMTTVGYGDFFPTTMAGRLLIGFPTMLLGIGILGYGLSLVATAMIESRILEAKGMKNILWDNHIIICNYSNIEKTQKIIQELRHDISTRDSHVVIIDNELNELPAELLSDLVHFVKGDPARETTLAQASLETCKAVLVQATIGDSAISENNNLKTCLMIQSLCPETYTVVECINPENAVFFHKAKCKSVISIASLTSQILTQELQDPGISTVFAELTSNAHGKQIYIQEIQSQVDTYEDLGSIYKKDNCVIIGIRRSSRNHLLPGASFKICSGDKVIMIADTRNIK